MKMLSTAAMILSMASASTFADDKIRILHPGNTKSAQGPASNFTGQVRIDSLFQADAPAKLGGGFVTFEPGSRTNWHTHPLGQTLIVTQGVGYIQEWNKPAQLIKTGDIVQIAPGVKHWHGAAPEIGMTHIALAEAENGQAADWLEPVTDEQYPGNQ